MSEDSGEVRKHKYSLTDCKRSSSGRLHVPYQMAVVISFSEDL